MKMKCFSRTTGFYAAFLLALTLSAAGCKSSQNANNTPASSADQSQQASSQQTADQAQPDPNDPANANIVPISNVTTGTGSGAGATGAQSASETAPAPSTSQSESAAGGQPAQSGGAEGSDQFSSNQYNEDNGYGQQPETYAPQPPPELPQYEQPPAPGEGYIWTPGNWRYAQAGYFWVPGAWVHAPYQGALWTPGYWGWRGGRYAYYRGYWGRHVGFYGGINYGFGYVGFGYHGGYWRGNDFFYNRTVNNINVRVVRNVYEYKVVNITNTRISFNGGRGGIQYRPRPVELVATVREQHNPPMQAQIQLRVNAEHDRQNFVEMNHGRPAMLVVDHPVQADRNVRPPAPIDYRGRTPQHSEPGMPQQRLEGRTPQHSEPGAQPHADRGHPGRPMEQQNNGKAPQGGNPNRQPQGHQNKQLQENNGQHPVPHQPTPQHAGNNQAGAHPDHNMKNDQKRNDQKRKPADQQPQ